MIAFLDIETGGFSITKNGVCEIAIIAVDIHTKSIIDKLQIYIKPYTRADDTDELVSYKDDAMEINGLSVEKLIQDGIDVIEAINQTVSFLEKHKITTICGHNSNAFDIPRIEYLFERFSNGYSIKHLQKEDTMQIAKNNYNFESHKLPFLCNHFGIDHKNQHTALGDAMATYLLYFILINN